MTPRRHDARRNVSDLAVDLGVARATAFRQWSTACWKPADRCWRVALQDY
ncbi:hypothetical protein ACVDG8_020350 [Mesorhizobium sp. ORM8.1]